MNDTLIFLHLPRTGGTTLRDILSKQYSDKVTFENKTLLDTDHNFNAENIRDVTYILKAQISNLKPLNSVPAMFLLLPENHQ